MELAGVFAYTREAIRICGGRERGVDIKVCQAAATIKGFLAHTHNGAGQRDFLNHCQVLKRCVWDSRRAFLYHHLFEV